MNMNMKWNNIFRAIGMLLASGISSQALALTPAVTPDYTVYTSGTSSQQDVIRAMFSSFCVPGTLDEYQERYVDFNRNDIVPALMQGSHFRAYFCTFKDGSPGTTDLPPYPSDATPLRPECAVAQSRQGWLSLGRGTGQ